MTQHYALVGDVGGTNARFALVEEGSLNVLQPATRLNADFGTLKDAVRDYLEKEAQGYEVARAAIAVACPATSDRIRFTNNHWDFSTAEMKSALELEQLIFINDFTAMALSIPHLPSSDFTQIGGGEPVENAPIAVLGPGTGLGVSGLIPTLQGGYVALSGEGGHVSFAPTNHEEEKILAYAQKQFPRVSAERLLCGAGLPLIHQALYPESEKLNEKEITHRAIEAQDEACRETLLTFAAMLGSFAGDLALTLGARGGVYIAGGIIPRFGDLFARSLFREQFEDKGRFRDYNAAIPTYVVAPHDNPALIGAASYLRSVR